MNKRIIHYGLPFLFILGFLLIQTPQFSLPFFNTLERIASDIRIRYTLKQQIDSRIVIVDVDENSLQELGQWPWKRATMSQLLDQLFDTYQIRTLGFDMVFAESEEDRVRTTLKQLSEQQLSDNPAFISIANNYLSGPTPDQMFADAMAKRNVVLGYIFNSSPRIQTNLLQKPLADIPDNIAEQLRIVKPLGYTANLPVFENSAHTNGFFDNPLVDDDGIFRRVPLIQLHKNSLYPSLALAVTRNALGDLPYDIQLAQQDNYLAIEQFQLGSLLIPLDLQGAIQVPYRGTAGSFEYISAADVMENRIDLEALQDKIVLMGTSAAGLQDLRSTPVGQNFPGVEVHANIISGIMDQTIPAKPGWTLAINLLITLIFGLLMIVLLNRLSPIGAIIFTAVSFMAVIVINLFAWNQSFVLNLVPPLACITFIFVWQTTTGFLIETRNKLRLTRQFGQYIPPSLVTEMVDSTQDLTLEGENRNLTVLFTDVRGFTTLSEGLNPTQLTQMMNDLLTPLTRVIHQNRGTIDKYMGDAIMAFWGAPLKAEDHAIRAVKTALELQKQASKMREDFIAKGLPALHIGVGLNTGDMNVGNMGSEFRMAYTVLGDAVNLGSRIEGLTRIYGVDTLISESTFAAVPDLVCQKIDLVQVKGKTEPVLIYEPLGFIGDLTETEIQSAKRINLFHDLYCQQNWQKAESILVEIEQEESPHNETFVALYRQRISHNQRSELPEDWCGVQIQMTK